MQIYIPEAGNTVFKADSLILDDFATLKQSIKSTFKKCWFRNHWNAMFRSHADDFYPLKFGESLLILKRKRLFTYSESHVACFQLRQCIRRQAQTVWLVSHISVIFLVKSRIYFLSFSYLHRPHHSPIKSHNTGYYRIL